MNWPISAHPWDFEHANRVEWASQLGGFAAGYLRIVAVHGFAWHRAAAAAELERRRRLS